MRILVTGGAGFIGSNLVRMLVHQGYEVLNFDKLTYAGNHASLNDVCRQSNYRFVQGDLCDASLVVETIQEFGPTWIMHLAAESHVDRSIDGPDLFIQSNVVGTFHLLQAARSYWCNLSRESRCRFRFLHVSSDEVYGSLGREGRFTEKTAYDPHSPYAATKAASDHLVRAWHTTYGLPTVVTNCSNNFGPFQYPEKLIPVTIISCLLGKPIPVYGRGENIRDWLYVEDHCRALLAVVSRGRIGETYNVGGGCEFSNIELVRQLCDIVDEIAPMSKPRGRPSSSLITFVADRPGHDFRYGIDSSKIQTELGWSPEVTHLQGLRKTVSWYLNNESWWQRLIKSSSGNEVSN